MELDAICLELNYIAKCISDKPIDWFTMVGNEIDEFFSPAEYYYRKYLCGDYKPSDLLYNSEKIAEYEFSLNNKTIHIDLLYGDVLSNGILSDLTIHPQLKVRFEEHEDKDFVKQVYDVVLKFLQFVHRKQDYNMRNIELFSVSDENKCSNIGYMFSSLYDKNLRPQSRIDASFMYYGNKINDLLDLIASDYKHFPTKHLGHCYNDMYYFSAERFAALCSAFEYEYKKNASYPQRSDLDNDELKKTAKQCIVGISNNNENAESFKNEAINRINQIGGQPGFKQRIINAYNYNREAIKNSEQNLFAGIGTIEECAKLINELRGKIVHNEIGYEFNEKEQWCIHFLDVLQFIMVLRRASYTQAEIEIIIGRQFHCNDKYFEQIRQ